MPKSIRLKSEIRSRPYSFNPLKRRNGAVSQDTSVVIERVNSA